VDGRATDAEMLGGFGDGVLFGHAFSIPQAQPELRPGSRFGPSQEKILIT
jgi:hypothetical protein